MLASIGIPLAIEAVKSVFGKGAPRIGRPKGKGAPRIGRPKGGKGAPRLGGPAATLFQRPPPIVGNWGAGDLLGTWDGGKKIQKRRRTSAGIEKPIQQHPNSRGDIVRRSRAPEGHSARPKFVNKPLSNFDLLKWIDFLKIPNFKGIFARDEVRPQDSQPLHHQFG